MMSSGSASPSENDSLRCLASVHLRCRRVVVPSPFPLSTVSRPSCSKPPESDSQAVLPANQAPSNVCGPASVTARLQPRDARSPDGRLPRRKRS